MQLQKQMQILQRHLDKERSAKMTLDNKRRSLNTKNTMLAQYVESPYAVLLITL